LIAATITAWEALGCSVKGASHERSGKPNQDAWKADVADDRSGIVIAVADGHGHHIHARSDRGSRYAVESAVPLLTQWLSQQADAGEEAVRASAKRLPAQLVEAWRHLVDADLRRDPANVAEPRTGAGFTTTVDHDRGYLLYGSTLVAAAVTDKFAARLRIGDGDIMIVADAHSVRPLWPSQQAAINLTESLCQKDAEARFRVDVEFFVGSPPELLLLSTDGYSNSFHNPKDFEQVGLDLRAYLARDGIDWVDTHIETWLKETSAAGSGDDVTLALAWRRGAASRTTNEEQGSARRRMAVVAALAAVVLVASGLLLRSWIMSHWDEWAGQKTEEPFVP